MIDQQLALHTTSEVQLILQPRPRSIALAACFVTLLSVGMPNAQAKQQCSAAMQSNPQGHCWSYRLIHERKCWYEGEPMLSKSSLEWPKEASGNPDSGVEV